MKNVLSVRLDDQAMERLRALAQRQQGTMVERLDVSVARVLDLLAEFGVRSPITHNDYLESYAAANSLVADKDDA